jgi:uncharacterized cupin superfamily protein/GNAT superfamily N-acetyltransferase
MPVIARVQIEAATLRDAPAVARVHVDCWRSTYAGLMPEARLQALRYEDREAMWRESLRTPKPRWHLWVAKDESGEVVGFSCGGPRRGDGDPLAGEIYAIYLRAAWQRQGIGRELFADSIEQLVRHGFTRASLWVLAANPARFFYEAMGGVEMGKGVETIEGVSLDRLDYGWPDLSAAWRRLRPRTRHPCIRNYAAITLPDRENSYPGSDERLSIGAPFSKALGLRKLGIHHELLPPGRRTSWPHAEADEEEFVYVLEGNPEVWIDGTLYRLEPGDGVGFASATGIAHTFLNNTSRDVRLLVVGEPSRAENRIHYPLHPARNAEIGSAWWSDVPQRALGQHDGRPDACRDREG